MAESKKEEVKEEEVKLNNDGLPVGQSVTFSQIAEANQKRAKKAKAQAAKEAAKPKAK